MENKEQIDLKKKKVAKNAKVIAWLSILYTPLAIICGTIDIRSSFVFILLLILFISPLIAIFYAAVNKMFIHILLLPFIINIILWIIFLGMFIDVPAHSNAAKAARIKSAMDQFRTNAEVYKSNSGSYGASINIDLVNGEKCKEVLNSLISKDSDGKALCDDIQSHEGEEFKLYSSANAYCMQKVLPGEAKTKWCLDSKGNVGSTYTECNLNNFSCKQ